MKESVIRTVVPVLYALLVKYGVVEFLGVDTAIITELLTAVVTGAFYAGIRFAEEHLDARFGWLLGLPKPPSYN